MKKSCHQSEQRTSYGTPDVPSKRNIEISELNRAIFEICEAELLHTMTFEGRGDGTVSIDVAKLAHGLSLFLKGIGKLGVLELEAYVENEEYFIICRSNSPLPAKRELANVAIAMREAGFDFFLQGEVVVLRARLRKSEVLTVYADGCNGIKSMLLIELYAFANNN